LPAEWLVEDGWEDYGIDLVIEIVRNDQITGAIFLMQLKGTDALTIRSGGYISHRCKTSTLAYFLERPKPIVYLVYDTKGKKGYWIWVQDYIRQSLKPDWRNQGTATIRIPVDRVFDENAVEEMALRASRYRERAKWLSAIEAARSPYFRYDLKVSEQAVTVNIWPRHPESLKDCPVQVTGTFKFDQADPEAKAALEALDRHFKTGEPVELDARFFEGFDIPEAFAGLLGHEEGFRTTKIKMGAAKTDQRFTFKMTILDQEECILSEIPYIDARVVRAGTEEITLSNEEQNIPLKMRLRLNFKECTNSVSMRMDFAGLNVVQVREFLEIQRALAKGKWIVLTNLSTGLSDRSEIPETAISAPDENLFILINDLAFIQEKTEQVLQWPGQITVAEAQLAKKLVNILETGQSHELVTGFHCGVNKTVARRLVDAYGGEKEQEVVRFNVPNHTVNLLGTELSLGPLTIAMPNAKLSEGTLRRLNNLDQLPDGATVPVDFDVAKPGAFFFYHRWLPKNLAPP